MNAPRWKPAESVTMRHSDVKHEALPAVNIKVHYHVDPTTIKPDSDMPDPDFPAWLRERWEGMGNDERESWYQDACTLGVESMIEDAQNIFRDDACALGVPSHNVEVWQEGRSGGWLVIQGLPGYVPDWDATLRTAWTAWTEGCAAQVADLSRAIAWSLYYNGGFEEWAAARDARNLEAELAESLITRTSA